jgi:hypothetical protein
MIQELVEEVCDKALEDLRAIVSKYDELQLNLKIKIKQTLDYDFEKGFFLINFKIFAKIRSNDNIDQINFTNKKFNQLCNLNEKLSKYTLEEDEFFEERIKFQFIYKRLGRTFITGMSEIYPFLVYPLLKSKTSSALNLIKNMQILNFSSERYLTVLICLPLEISKFSERLFETIEKIFSEREFQKRKVKFIIVFKSNQEEYFDYFSGKIAKENNLENSGYSENSEDSLNSNIFPYPNSNSYNEISSLDPREKVNSLMISQKSNLERKSIKYILKLYFRKNHSIFAKYTEFYFLDQRTYFNEKSCNFKKNTLYCISTHSLVLKKLNITKLEKIKTFLELLKEYNIKHSSEWDISNRIRKFGINEMNENLLNNQLNVKNILREFTFDSVNLLSNEFIHIATKNKFILQMSLEDKYYLEEFYRLKIDARISPEADNVWKALTQSIDKACESSDYNLVVQVDLIKLKTGFIESNKSLENFLFHLKLISQSSDEEFLSLFNKNISIYRKKLYSIDETKSLGFYFIFQQPELFLQNISFMRNLMRIFELISYQTLIRTFQYFQFLPKLYVNDKYFPFYNFYQIKEPLFALSPKIDPNLLKSELTLFVLHKGNSYKTLQYYEELEILKKIKIFEEIKIMMFGMDENDFFRNYSPYSNSKYDFQYFCNPDASLIKIYESVYNDFSEQPLFVLIKKDGIIYNMGKSLKKLSNKLCNSRNCKKKPSIFEYELGENCNKVRNPLLYENLILEIEVVKYLQTQNMYKNCLAFEKIYINEDLTLKSGKIEGEIQYLIYQ